VKTFSLSHLSDQALLRNAPEAHAQERSNAAIGLAHIAEIDSRKLYRQAGHPSIHSYCVNELLLSPQAAFKRIQAARAARRFPAIFVALAEGRLHLSAIVTLAGSLTDETVNDLLRAAENKTKFELERLLAGTEAGCGGTRTGGYGSESRRTIPGDRWVVHRGGAIGSGAES
jgi:hypothetical protein